MGMIPEEKIARKTWIKSIKDRAAVEFRLLLIEQVAERVRSGVVTCGRCGSTERNAGALPKRWSTGVELDTEEGEIFCPKCSAQIFEEGAQQTHDR